MSDRIAVPPARKDRLVVEKLGDETLIYDLDRHQAHSLNASAAVVWENCDGTRTIADLAALLPQSLPAAERESAVRRALEQLTEAHLLSEPMAVRREMVSESRRALLVKIGVSAAIAAVPLVTSIGVPTAQAQQSPPSADLLLDGTS
jgi:hypothetical protein